MSAKYQLHCKSCNRTWKVITGHDMLDGCKEHVIGHFQEKYQKKAAEMIRDHPAPPYGFSYAVGTCTGCREIVSVPVIRRGEEIFAEPCPVCQAEVKLAEGSVTEMVCPLCGGALEAENTTFAD